MKMMTLFKSITWKLRIKASRLISKHDFRISEEIRAEHEATRAQLSGAEKRRADAELRSRLFERDLAAARDQLEKRSQES
jgi:hypothetical protein